MWSGSDVKLGALSQANGAVLAMRSVFKNGSATVTGTSTANGDAQGTEVLKWNIVHPSLAGASEVIVTAGEVRALLPGTYDIISVAAGGTLSLYAGTYHVARFQSYLRSL